MRFAPSTVVLASTLALAALAACASSSAGFSGGGIDGSVTDGGVQVGHDGAIGPTSDATLHDAGTDGTTLPHDGGVITPHPDGSTGTTDTGTKPHDAAVSLPDGPIDFDGGWHPADAGTQTAVVGNGGTTVITATGADGTSPGKFGGGNGTAPTLVYPANGVMLPPNVTGIAFHFIPASGQTLFRFSFVTPSQTIDIYTGCTAVGAGCVYTPDTTTWTTLASYARGTVPVTYTLTGVNGGSPGAVGTTSAATLTFADQDLTGGIYYWNTAGIIERYDLANPSLGVEDYLIPSDVGALFCVGCHVISREGYSIVAGKDIPAGLANASLLDVPSKAAIDINGSPAVISGNFYSFSPDQEHLLTSDGVSVSWLEIATGQNHAAVAASGTMPDWAPDGLHMVYAQPSSPAFFGSPGVDSAGIASMHFNGTGWDTPTTLVPFAGENNYYPAYSPDGQWVVFNRSPSNANSFGNADPDPDAGTDPDGQLWLVPAAGGTAVQLSKAGAPASWPKWAPVVHTYYDGKLMWLTFSSGRAYGLRLAEWQETQLWMVAIDPAKIGTGSDPSFPPFWLPFQDITTGNHIAQWSTAVRRAGCAGGGSCPTRETCKSGVCVPG